MKGHTMLARCLLFVAVMLSSAAAPRERYGTVAGQLFWFGSPKVGATIFLTNETTSLQMPTGGLGFYSFDVPPGTYDVTAPGPWANEPFRTEIAVVEEGQTTVVDFYFW